MTGARDKIILFIAQGAYSGRSPFAPGTAGTVAAVLLYLLLRGMALPGYGAVCMAVIVIGTLAAGRAEVLLGRKDAPSIVIDEVAGYLVSMLLVPGSWQYIAAAFLLFRFFDVLKPWPLDRLQRVPGGPGVMLDDLGAGLYTNLVLQAARHWLAS